LILQGDLAVQRIVTAIKASPVWSESRSAIVILWDENDYSRITSNQVVAIVDTNYGEHHRLTVRQDRDRLCYTLNGRADAPTIRVRLGSDLIITLRNEITDSGAIDAVTGPGKLTVATDRVPPTPGLFPVVPGMKHHATGATNLHVHGFAVPPVKCKRKC
jgi:hypothetical protein